MRTVDEEQLLLGGACDQRPLTAELQLWKTFVFFAVSSAAIFYDIVKCCFFLKSNFNQIIVKINSCVRLSQITSVINQRPGEIRPQYRNRRIKEVAWGALSGPGWGWNSATLSCLDMLPLCLLSEAKQAKKKKKLSMARLLSRAVGRCPPRPPPPTAPVGSPRLTWQGDLPKTQRTAGADRKISAEEAAAACFSWRGKARCQRRLPARRGSGDLGKHSG